MGQATSDPPKTEEATPAPSAPVAATPDDLLAQMAGDEIDRLLAEAENGPAPAPVVEVPPVETPAQAVVAEKTDAIEPAAPATEVAKTEPTPDVVAQPTVAVESAPATESPARADVSQPQAAVVADAAKSVIADSPAAHEESLPLYIRILDMLISPMEAFPQCVRNALGPVAIATFFHAVGLIVYVSLFRHHPHGR